MKLLPSQQTEQQRTCLIKLFVEGELTLCEPCDCGSMVRHNNGGNYHDIYEYKMDSGKMFRNKTSTSDYAPNTDWEEMSFTEAIAEIAELAAEGWYASSISG